MTENVLLRLSEDQRLIRFIKISLILQKVGEKQLKILKDYERRSKDTLHRGFFYFIKTLDGFWESFDFLLSLRRGKYRAMAHYPVRSMFENLLRMEYYINQKKAGQNYITDVETLRIYKRLYDEGILKGENVEEFKNAYLDSLKLASLEKDPSFELDKVKEGKLNPFPTIEELIKVSKLPDFKDIYFHYRILCEHSHGKLIASIMRKSNPKSSYRQMLMYGSLCARGLLKIVDNHIQGATKAEVNEAITRTNNIVNAPA